jgi:dTDP-4-amino-4,6-dideoxygalactose transaminase
MASVLSFSPSKLCPGGEGGMILTNKERYAEAYVNARNMISRMDTDSAINILEQIKVLPELLEWKRDTYNFYRRKFPDFRFQEGDGNHQVIGMLADTNDLRDEIIMRTADKMDLRAYYKPLHLRTTGTWNLPITEDVANRILCLPSWYGVDRDRVVELIREAMDEGG